MFIILDCADYTVGLEICVSQVDLPPQHPPSPCVLRCKESRNCDSKAMWSAGWIRLWQLRRSAGSVRAIWHSRVDWLRAGSCWNLRLSWMRLLLVRLCLRARHKLWLRRGEKWMRYGSDSYESSKGEQCVAVDHFQGPCLPRFLVAQKTLLRHEYCRSSARSWRDRYDANHFALTHGLAESRPVHDPARLHRCTRHQSDY